MDSLESVQAFPVGARLSLERIEQEGTDVLHIILSRYEDGLLILSPDKRQRGLPNAYPPGTRLIARSEADMATLVAEFSIIGTTAGGELVARVPTQVDRFAKRRFHRTPVDLPLTIRDRACRALDLSGCGLLAHCPPETQILHRDVVEAMLSLGQGPLVAVRMYAVRTGDGPYRSRLVGFDFLEISEKDQDRVIAYVLRQERKRLQQLRGL
ncbi:MAG: PilZ domain-containing protein [Thermaerobacter sp.]|nr:PilZ domain-containing protein [Thermaerobacter sp.]